MDETPMHDTPPTLDDSQAKPRPVVLTALDPSGVVQMQMSGNPWLLLMHTWWIGISDYTRPDSNTTSKGGNA